MVTHAQHRTAVRQGWLQASRVDLRHPMLSMCQPSSKSQDSLTSKLKLPKPKPPFPKPPFSRPRLSWSEVDPEVERRR
eukprot:4518886-Pyramimonas_sp.AAC.1